MGEWWTYRPSDFLMFSARAYGRLLELYNRDWWPLHLLAVAAGLALLWLAVRRPREAARWVPAVLAVAWLWVAWAFHWERHAQVNTAAPWFAAVYALQGVMLLVAGTGKTLGPGFRRDDRGRGRGLGVWMAALAVVAYPLLAPLTGRPWVQAEVFGLAPEPTALATVGLLLAVPVRWRGGLLVLPVVAVAVGATTFRLLYFNA